MLDQAVPHFSCFSEVLVSPEQTMIGGIDLHVLSVLYDDSENDGHAILVNYIDAFTTTHCDDRT